MLDFVGEGLFLRGIGGRRRGGFNPASVFSAGVQGIWLDPSDLSTMFTDPAGTTPVTADGEQIALMLDKRKGLVLGPEQMSAAPSLDGWVFQHCTAVIEGGSIKITNTGTGYGIAYKELSCPSGTALRLSFAGRRVRTRVVNELNATVIYAAFSFSSTATSGVALVNGDTSPGILFNTDNNTAGAVFYIDFPISIRELPGNHARQDTLSFRPRYKTDGVARWMSFDGNDDFLATYAIDLTGADKVGVFAGVRKLSDAAAGIVVEHSINTAVNAGSFRIDAPSSPGANNYRFLSTGSGADTAVTAAVAAAPHSDVLTGIGDIGGDLATLRVNASQVAQSTANQGTGNFGNYPLYIGRRGGVSLPFLGNIYGLIVVGKLPSAAEIANIETFLNQKTGAY